MKKRIPLPNEYKTVHENRIIINPPKEGTIITSDGESYKIPNSDKTEEIIDLIKTTPNDQELGAKIRELFATKKE